VNIDKCKTKTNFVMWVWSDVVFSAWGDCLRVVLATSGY